MDATREIYWNVGHGVVIPMYLFALIAFGLIFLGLTAYESLPVSEMPAIDFGFCKMKVVESAPKKVVHWSCTKGPKEWIGTHVIFEMKWKDDQTFVIFRHAGWKEPVEFMHHCSTKWATFLLSLRDWLERSEGRPSPYDIKIHVGD